MRGRRLRAPHDLWERRERAAPRWAPRGDGRSSPRSGVPALLPFFPLPHSTKRGFSYLISKQTFLFWRFVRGQPPR